MRTLAIGDIHGCSAALDALLASIQLEAGDVLVTLGDYVDRGPDSKGVLDRLIDLRRSHAVVPILGNHDQMMLDARAGEPEKLWWIDHDAYGELTLGSYGTREEAGTLASVPSAHWEFLEACLDYHETQTHVFVHANLAPELDLCDQPVFTTRWDSLSPELSTPHLSGKVMICGHTSQKSGRPLNLGHAICLDTYVYGGGWLTCLDVGSGQVWQANQRGDVRMARIDEV